MFLGVLRGCPAFSGLLCVCLLWPPSFLLCQPSCPDCPRRAGFAQAGRRGAASLLTLLSPALLSWLRTIVSKSPLKEQTFIVLFLQSSRSQETKQVLIRYCCVTDEERHSHVYQNELRMLVEWGEQQVDWGGRACW